MKWVYDDGGRAVTWYKGKAGDYVKRAVAIATGQPYDLVYEALAEVNANTRIKRRSKTAPKRSARNGVQTRSAGFKRYMESLGWQWTPTMKIGSGCTVHLVAEELPAGTLIVRGSKHYTCVIDHVIYDTFNPSDRGTTIYPPGTPADKLPKGAYWLENGNGWAYEPGRCVYGYWTRREEE